MPRKVYSDEEREQVKEALMSTVIQCIVERGLIHSSIETLCRKVGISKTFFYSFFPSKEELVLHALRYQQPRLLDYARQLMEDPALSWRAGVETFLKTAAMEPKTELLFCPLKRSSKYATAFQRRIFMPSDRIKSVFMGNCWPFSDFQWRASIPDCSAIWLWP